jgi:MarR family transcriptional regulator for hemolysin
MNHSPADIRVMLGPWLQSVARVWRAAADTAFARHGLTFATGMALIYIHRLGGSMRQGELARCMAIEGPSLVRLLDQLCAAGLVARRDDAQDRRAKFVDITASGTALMLGLEPSLNSVRERMLAGVTDAELATTLRVLAAIADAGGVDLPVPALRHDAGAPLVLS